jgi:hypothetical protein
MYNTITEPADTISGFIEQSYTSGLSDLYNGKPFGDAREKMHRNMLPNLHKHGGHHIDGYYYIHMVNGPWLEHAISLLPTVDDMLGFPKANSVPFELATNHFGTLAKEVHYTAPII